ncbi:MAG TPA: FAD-binding oxidoreductase [Flavisolibacter sp.]|jgi:FAD/FMN-containing dehydrogenase|nr:FAD-binding oxidoreductase [Flavisolibacter sp.]
MSSAKHKISGWGNYPMVDAYLMQVRNEKEARAAITEEMIPRGLGRSYADQAINQEKRVALFTGMNHLLSFDAEKGILECEAGVSLEEIITALAPRGWFPFICPGTKFVTIGGAIANDIHGKAHHFDGSFVNCVLSFTILVADGRVLTASRTENEDLFWANFGGLGLLGTILTARLQLRKIETTYFKQKAIVIKSLDHLLESLEQYDKEYNYSVAWIDPMAKGKKIGSGVLTLGNAATLEDLPAKYKLNPLKLHPKKKLNLPIFLPNFALNNLTARLLNRVIAFVQKSPAGISHYEKFFFPLDAIDNWNRGYGKRGFIQYQFVIPKEGGRERLIDILQSIAESGCTPFLNVFKTMGKSQGLLSFPFEGYTLAIDFPMSEKLKRYIPILDKKVLDANGRIYLGKDALLDKATFQTMYPQAAEWKKIKAKYDPDNRFTSNISRRLGLGDQ